STTTGLAATSPGAGLVTSLPYAAAVFSARPLPVAWASPRIPSRREGQAEAERSAESGETSQRFAEAWPPSQPQQTQIAEKIALVAFPDIPDI
ncbi:hypothetical protein, partial [Haemophilus parainfluenzae]|uniref:hypothetical protein n=1 Tax=Haemophilus parainfluenzae TaxID=729 RepID=UPI001CED9020